MSRHKYQMGARFPAIIDCPHCAARLILHYPDPTFARREDWTDGRDNHDISLDFSDRLCQCSRCNRLFWEEALRDDRPKQYDSEAAAHFPTTADEFYRALHDLESSVAQTVWLRLNIWWHDNDPIRQTRDPARFHLANAPMEFTPRATANLIELFELFDESSEKHLLYRAEIARELTFFDESQRLLSPSRISHYRKHAAVLRRLCEDRNRYVSRFAVKGEGNQPDQKTIDSFLAQLDAVDIDTWQSG